MRTLRACARFSGCDIFGPCSSPLGITAFLCRIVVFVWLCLFGVCCQSEFTPSEWSRVVGDVKDELDADELVRAYVCPPPPRPLIDPTATPVFECKWSDAQVTQMLRHLGIDHSGEYEEKLFRLAEHDVCISENSLTDSVNRYAPALGPALCVPYTASDPNPLSIGVRGWPFAMLAETALRLWRHFPLSAGERPALFDLPLVRDSIDRTASDQGWFMSAQLAPIVLRRFMQLRTIEQIAAFVNAQGDKGADADADNDRRPAFSFRPHSQHRQSASASAGANSNSSSSGSVGGGPYPPCQRRLLMGGRSWVEGFEVHRAACRNSIGSRAAPSTSPARSRPPQPRGADSIPLAVVELELELMLGS